MASLAALFDQRLIPAAKPQQHHETVPLRGSITPIEGYSRKLRRYLMEASPYWHVRHRKVGRRVYRSTPTAD